MTVEIPAIPEDYELLTRRILKIQEIGVKYLNIHQLSTTRYNYKNFIKRNYTFLRLPGIPIFESEIAALKLIRYAADNNISLSINYCSARYKNEFQGKGYRTRAISLLKRDYEGQTRSGYIRHLSVKATSANIKKIIRVLKKNKCQEKLWSLDGARREISFHHSLLRYINFKRYNLIIRYFDLLLVSHINSHADYKEINLSPNRKIFIKRKAVTQPEELGSISIDGLRKLFIENREERDVFKYFYENYNLKTKKTIKDMKKQVKILIGLKRWERIKPVFEDQ